MKYFLLFILLFPVRLLFAQHDDTGVLNSEYVSTGAQALKKGM